MPQLELDYTVLRAVPDLFRGDALSYGLVIWEPGRARVWVDNAGVKRLAALGPNYRRWNAEQTQAALQTELDRMPTTDMRRQWLQLFVSDPSPQQGRVVIDGLGDIEQQLEQRAQDLLARLVRPPVATLPALKRKASKRSTKLAHELRDWLRGAKAYSTRADDISRGKVVAN